MSCNIFLPVFLDLLTSRLSLFYGSSFRSIAASLFRICCSARHINSPISSSSLSLPQIDGLSVNDREISHCKDIIIILDL